MNILYVLLAISIIGVFCSFQYLMFEITNTLEKELDKVRKLKEELEKQKEELKSIDIYI